MLTECARVAGERKKGIRTDHCCSIWIILIPASIPGKRMAAMWN